MGRTGLNHIKKGGLSGAFLLHNKVTGVAAASDEVLVLAKLSVPRNGKCR